MARTNVRFKVILSLGVTNLRYCPRTFLRFLLKMVTQNVSGVEGRRDVRVCIGGEAVTAWRGWTSPGRRRCASPCAISRRQDAQFILGAWLCLAARCWCAACALYSLVRARLFFGISSIRSRSGLAHHVSFQRAVNRCGVLSPTCNEGV
jgi:hypothetical protein